MKRIFSILLVAIMLFSTLAIGTQAQTITTESSQNKLTDELKAYLETVDDDEYVPIYIWLNEQSEDMVYLVLSDNLGMSVTKSSEESYITTRTTAKAELLSKGLENLAKTPEYSLQARATGKVDIANLTAETFKAQANIPEIMTNEEVKNCLESGMTSDEIINLSERTQFLSEYRTARKSLNNATNEQFYKLLDLDKCKNVYLDSLLAYVRMDCKKSYIDNLSSMSAVKEIDYVEEITIQEQPLEQNDTTRASTTPANITIGYDMFPQNTVDGVTYTGAGIKIGVRELGFYDQSAHHLTGKTIIFEKDDDDSVESHATAVMSIIFGQQKSYQSDVYQGIAPGASAFFSSKGGWQTLSNELICPSLQWLIIDNACHVVSMSSTRENTSLYGTYSVYDKYIDDLILQYRVVFVKSAGNEGNNSCKITNPGMAYNAITVGNADSVDLENGKYTMYYTSSFLECLDENNKEYLTNKPDISAFGRRIRMLNNDGIPSACFPIANEPTTDDYVTGTSYSTPMVAGTVALLMQANPNLIGNPDVVKAILVGGADENAISGFENGLKNTSTFSSNSQEIENPASVMREKSGVGLLNIPASIRMAKNPMYYSYDFSFDSQLEYKTSERYYFNENSTIKLGLVFEKKGESENPILPYNIDVQVLDFDDNVLIETTGTLNNIEAIVFTIKSSGFYKFRVKGQLLPNQNFDEDYVRTTLFFTCGACVEKELNTAYTRWESTVTCDCGGLRCEEIHQYVQISKTISDIMGIRFDVYYSKAMSKIGNDFDYFDYSYYVTPKSGVTILSIELMNLDITTTNSGEIRQLSYQVLVEKNGVAQITGVYLIMEIDYYNKTVVLS